MADSRVAGFGSQSLEGRVAVVTGASRGLGRALVREMVANGVRVVMLARPSAALDQAVADFGKSALGCACDVRSSESVDAAVARGVAHFGQINILVNNAAACLVDNIESVSDADVRTQIETNLLGAIWCARSVIPHLRRGGGGDIVSISSESVNTPVPFMTTYAASKAALEAFCTGLRAELRPYGVRVTVVRSGAMQTSITDQWSPSQKEAFFSAYASSARQAETGANIDPGITARAVVDILKLPPDASARLIEVGGR